jgi:hypothetical protein
MRLLTTLALLAAIVGGVAFSASAMNCTTTCNSGSSSYGNSCQTSCW